jgi:hypothetical protein
MKTIYRLSYFDYQLTMNFMQQVFKYLVPTSQ